MTGPIQLDISQYSFRDLVDVPAFARMLESFFKATGIPNGVVDASGELLSLSAGVNACTEFHRVQPQAAERCRERTLAIIHDLRDGHVAVVLPAAHLQSGKDDVQIPLAQCRPLPPPLDEIENHAQGSNAAIVASYATGGGTIPFGSSYQKDNGNV
jgi:hypothetical protein